MSNYHWNVTDQMNNNMPEYGSCRLVQRRDRILWSGPVLSQFPAQYQQQGLSILI